MRQAPDDKFLMTILAGLIFSTVACALIAGSLALTSFERAEVVATVK